MTPQEYVVILRSAYRLEALRFHLAIAERDHAELLRRAGFDPTKALRFDDENLAIQLPEDTN
jgi:hypothetical protein